MTAILPQQANVNILIALSVNLQHTVLVATCLKQPKKIVKKGFKKIQMVGLR